jgi:hypothetical protein
MFEDWKKAWQQAIENFQRELEDDTTSPPQLASMKREVATARKALEQLQIELERCREQVAEEEQQEQVCRRRGEMAARIPDQETVRIATGWAERHQQRARVLRQKAEALSAELTMRQGDFAEMEQKVAEVAATLGPAAAGAEMPRSRTVNADHDKEDVDFRQLDRAAREKAAEARLEELKKKMR